MKRAADKRLTNSPSLPFVQVISAAVLWGTIGVFVRTLTSIGFAPMRLIELRSAISAAAMFVFLVIKFPKSLKIDLKDCWMFAGTGIISFVLFNFCYFNAINLIPLSAAAILLYTAPVFVSVMSCIFFKEKMTRPKLISLVLAFAGCAAASGITGGGLNFSGVAFGLLSGFLYALYSIFGKAALKKYSSETVTFYTFVFATLGALPFSAASAAVSLTPSVGGYLILFALISGAVPYLLYTSGLAKLSADKAAIVASAEPVAAAFTGMIFFAEPFTAGSVIGLVCIISAIILLSPKKDGLKKALIKS